MVGQKGDVEMIGVQMRDVEIVRPFDGVAAALGQVVVAGNTNHEPKKAGTNHGSQTIEP